MQRTLKAAGDHRFDSKTSVEPFDSCQCCVLMTNADLFLGCRAEHQRTLGSDVQK